MPAPSPPSHDHPWADAGNGLLAWPPEGVSLPCGALAAAVLAPNGTRYLAMLGEGGRLTCLGSVNRRDLFTTETTIPGPAREGPVGLALARMVPVAAASGNASPSHVALAMNAAWPDGEGRAIFEAFRAACGSATLSLAIESAPTAWLGALDRLAGAEAVDAALARLPLLYAVLAPFSRRFRNEDARALALPLIDPRLGLDGLVEGILAIDRVHPLLAGRPDRLRLRRVLAGVEGTWMPLSDAQDLLRCSGSIPTGWLPADRQGIRAALRLVVLARALAKASSGALDVDVLLAPVKGEWGRATTAIDDLFPSGAIEEPARFGEWAKDMAYALAREVVEPALARDRVVLPPRDSLPVAWGLLFGGKGLVACARSVADWHGRSWAMTARISRISSASPRRWPALFGRFRTPDGIELREITRFSELCEEGEAMAHCVATYDEGCVFGRHAILSVRDRVVGRLSTVQVGPDLIILQHAGPGNARPPHAAVKALALWRSAMGRPWRIRLRTALGPWRKLRGRVGRAIASRRVRGEWSWHLLHPYDPRREGTVETAIETWSGYLPRTARTPEAIARLLSYPGPSPMAGSAASSRSIRERAASNPPASARA